MAPADDTDLIRRFEEFYRDDYRDEIEAFAESYPDDQHTLYIDWTDLDRYDSGLAGDVINEPERLLECATKALERYSPLDGELRDARVLVNRIGDPIPPTDLRSRHLGTLVEVSGRVLEVDADGEVVWEIDGVGVYDVERIGNGWNRSDTAPADRLDLENRSAASAPPGGSTGLTATLLPPVVRNSVGFIAPLWLSSLGQAAAVAAATSGVLAAALVVGFRVNRYRRSGTKA